MNRLLVAHTPIGDSWWATSLKGTESLSELYAFTLILESKHPDIDGQSLIGEVCAVELQAQRDLKRYFSGQIVKVLACGKEDRHWKYEVTIAPKLWHASRRADFKIWQSMTVQAITDEVLQKNALRYEWRLKNQYKTWEYLVQYGETDLNFLCRLFEHEGIYYWFEHGPDGETLILGDHLSTHETFGGYERIPFYPPEMSGMKEERYLAWRAAREPEPGRYQHRDYDFKKPSTDLTSEFIDPRGHLFDQYEIYDYPGHYTETGVGTAYATVRLEALQSQQDVIELTGNVRGAIPGCYFALSKHPVDALNREWMITRAHYEAINNDYEAAGRNEGASFNVRIEAMPAERQYRSLLKTPKPRTRGPETAVIVGPPGSEIHTDQWGRVKVHFHWDRYGKKNGEDSCWIRVSYPGAGSNYGIISIPRVGQEVIVDYEYGDPDRPLITGRVYNAEQMPPWDLPANKTQSGTLTRSTLQGTPDNANALRFEDAKGREQIWLHAERNQDIEVELDETHWVGQDREKTIDRDETTVVHRHRTETVDGNETITIHQNRTETVDQNEVITIHQNRTETVDQNEVITIHENRTETVDGNETITIHQNRTETVDGNEVIAIHQNRTETVDSNETVTVNGSQKLTVNSSRKKTIASTETNTVGTSKIDTVGMTHLDTVGMARMSNIGMIYSLNVGMLMNTMVGKKQSTKVGADKTLTVGATYAADIGKTMKLNVGETFELVCGASKIVLTKDCIYLQSKKIELLAEKTINGDADLIHWNCGVTSPPPNPDGAEEENPPVNAEGPDVAATAGKSGALGTMGASGVDKIVAGGPDLMNILEPDFDGGMFSLVSGALGAIGGGDMSAALGALSALGGGDMGAALGGLTGRGGRGSGGGTDLSDLDKRIGQEGFAGPLDDPGVRNTSSMSPSLSNMGLGI